MDQYKHDALFFQLSVNQLSVNVAVVVVIVEVVVVVVVIFDK